MMIDGFQEAVKGVGEKLQCKDCGACAIIWHR